MDDVAESRCGRDSQTITGILRGILLDDDIDLLTIVLWGEKQSTELRPWFDQIVRSTEYGGPVTCHPWLNMNFRIVAATANEVCSMLVRAVYLRILPDKPALLGESETIDEVADRFDTYLEANETAVQRRLDKVYESVNSAEWSRVIALAEIERANNGNAIVWHPEYFTVKQLTQMRKAVKLPHSATTMTREIDAEFEKGRIQRDGNKPMRLRLDLHTEWNTPVR